LVYELAHNIAKLETHQIEGKAKQVIVHRKGATRSFGPKMQGVPDRYQTIGQPVIIPGDMGRYSYVLAGNENSMKETFGSSCHGAGRRLSRKKAMKTAKGREIQKELQKQGIIAMAASRATMVEEIPEAYKDVSDVVSTVHNADIARKVVRLKPMGVIKG
jgi:tRNA-splicing ligase RtcB